ncbi:THAP domain-containing protein 1-like [Bombyx mandarina]|uniref:THAP domain-containing protein 1-like n=1 Tax=Bombyx mandarina TaxID=7092 RepID=A0A6J2KEJ0_BOMMA|nr:THAP domain-containing protein 1-like [Bombyx mandarina]
MPMCSVIGCGKKKTPNQPSLTIHRIPRNESRKKKWLEAIRMENIKSNVKDVYICSRHFDDKCFNKTMDVIRLRDDAVPSKFTGLPRNPAPVPISETSEAATSALPMTTTAVCTASFASVPGTSGVDNLLIQTHKIKKLEDKCDFLRKKVKRLHETVRRQKIKIVQFENIIKYIIQKKPTGKNRLV